MAQDREMLISWIQDAHAMEQALIPVLEAHAREAERFPEIRRKDEQHAEATRRHAALLEECLARMGEAPSPVKSTLGGLMGTMESMATLPFQDRPMKNLVMDYSAEAMEIASYRSLIAAARELGDENTARTCEQILRDEEAMSRWIEGHLSSAVRQSLRESAGGPSGGAD